MQAADPADPAAADRQLCALDILLYLHFRQTESKYGPLDSISVEPFEEGMKHPFDVHVQYSRP